MAETEIKKLNGRTVCDQTARDSIPKSASDIGADPAGTGASKVNAHNISLTAHADIRVQLQNIADQLNAFLNVDDETRNELSEVLDLIDANEELIASITTNKVNVKDIIDNLTTNVSNKPLSASQGVVLKGLIDTLQNSVDGMATKQEVEQLSKEIVDHKARQNINGLDYGVKGDGSTDDSAAINALLSGGWKTVYLPNKTYKISSPILLSGRYAEFICDGTIQYDGEDAAVQILHNSCSANVYKINAPNGTGIRVDSTAHSAYKAYIKSRFITAKIGLHLYANGKSMHYGSYDIGTIDATEVPIKLESTDTTLLNEQKFNIVSLGGSETTAYGIYMKNANTCRFMCGAIEGISDDGIAIYLENGEYNTFENFRCMENYGAKRIKLVGVCRANDFRLSYCRLSEVDISELDITSDRSQYNRINGQISPDGDGHFDDMVEINRDYGFLYNPEIAIRNSTGASRGSVALSNAGYSDNLIKQLSNNIIPTFFLCDTANLNGTTWTLSGLYTYGYISGGKPLLFKFGSNGKITLKDNQGNTIFDNSDGKYLGKTVSVQSLGVDESSANIWEVIVLGEDYVTESELLAKGFLTQHQDLSAYVKKTEIPSVPTKTSQLTNDSGFLTAVPSGYVTETELSAKGYLTQHQDISGKVDKTETLTLTGVDADGTIHTWTIYGK